MGQKSRVKQFSVLQVCFIKNIKLNKTRVCKIWHKKYFNVKLHQNMNARTQKQKFNIKMLKCESTNNMNGEEWGLKKPLKGLPCQNMACQWNEQFGYDELHKYRKGQHRPWASKESFLPIFYFLIFQNFVGKLECL